METIKKIFNKMINRETVLYGIVGLGTSVLNVVLFQWLIIIGVNYKTANFWTLIIVKLLAYICNKKFVFCSKTANFLELLKEIGRFVVARGATMAIDYLGLIFMVEVLHIDKLISKCFITIGVIIINYFIGKKHVFKSVNNR